MVILDLILVWWAWININAIYKHYILELVIISGIHIFNWSIIVHLGKAYLILVIYHIVIWNITFFIFVKLIIELLKFRTFVIHLQHLQAFLKFWFFRHFLYIYSLNDLVYFLLFIDVNFNYTILSDLGLWNVITIL